MLFKVKETVKVIDAVQWFKDGDISDIVHGHWYSTDLHEDDVCEKCGEGICEHGYMENLYTMVCPGDWIINYPDGKYIIMDEDTFDKLYAPFNPTKEECLEQYDKILDKIEKTDMSSDNLDFEHGVRFKMP